MPTISTAQRLGKVSSNVLDVPGLGLFTVKVVSENEADSTPFTKTVNPLFGKAPMVPPPALLLNLKSMEELRLSILL